MADVQARSTIRESADPETSQLQRSQDIRQPGEADWQQFLEIAQRTASLMGKYETMLDKKTEQIEPEQGNIRSDNTIMKETEQQLHSLAIEVSEKLSQLEDCRQQKEALEQDLAMQTEKNKLLAEKLEDLDKLKDLRAQQSEEIFSLKRDLAAEKEKSSRAADACGEMIPLAVQRLRNLASKDSERLSRDELLKGYLPLTTRELGCRIILIQSTLLGK